MADPPALLGAARRAIPTLRDWPTPPAAAAAAVAAVGAASPALPSLAWVMWGAVGVLAAQAAASWGVSRLRKRLAACGGRLEAAPKARPDRLVLAVSLTWDLVESAQRSSGRRAPGAWFVLAFAPDSGALALDLALREKRVNAAILGNAPVVLRPMGRTGGSAPVVVVEARYAAVPAGLTLPFPCIDASARSEPPEFGDGKGALRPMVLFAFDHGGDLP